MTYRLIDLFCGCGGMTLGFKWDRLFEDVPGNPVCISKSPPPDWKIDVVWANDMNRHALNTYKTNFDPAGKHSAYGAIEDILTSGVKIPKADIVIGGPPCQGFSLLNKQRENDGRRALWRQFIDVAVKAEARVIVMENVPQLLSSPEFLKIKARLIDSDFAYIMAHTLCAADFGVPQIRKRAVIIASRNHPVTLPVPTHFPAAHHMKTGKRTLYQPIMGRIKWVSTKDAVGDLPPPVGTSIRAGDGPCLSLHFGRRPTEMSRERYKAVPPGGNRFDLQRNRPDITPKCWLNKPKGSTDLFGRLWWDKPSVTIRTEFFKPEKGRYLHPEADRPLTHREAARLQSFPDNFVFTGSKNEIAKQIGNAVPPLLSHAIALKVMECLREKTTENDMHQTLLTYKEYLNEEIRYVRFGKNDDPL